MRNSVDKLQETINKGHISDPVAIFLHNIHIVHNSFKAQVGKTLIAAALM